MWWRYSSRKSFRNINILEQSKIYNNSSVDSGGAILIFSGILKITKQAEIYNNSSKDAGAIFSTFKVNSFIYDNAKIYNNKAIKFGGAIYFCDREFNMSRQAEIYNNVASVNGCGIYNVEGILNISDYGLIHDNGNDSAFNSTETIDLTCDETVSHGNKYKAQIRTIFEGEEGIAPKELNTSLEDTDFEKSFSLKNRDTIAKDTDSEEDPFKDFSLDSDSQYTENKTCNICSGELRPGDRIFECCASSEGNHTMHLQCMLKSKNYFTVSTITCPVCKNKYHMQNNSTLRIFIENIYNKNKNENEIVN